jgi:RNA polymerase sigma-70 factor (ECF subfamily)
MAVEMLSHKAKYQEELTDEEVVDRIRAGETYLFEIIMRRYNQRLFRVANSILKNAGEAEDVMQDAYVRAYTHLNQFAEKAKFSNWLTKIAVYESLARLRRSKRFTSMDEFVNREGIMGNLKAESGDPAKDLFRRQMVEMLENAISTLPRKYRLVFMLRDAEGLNTHDTAESLGISEEAVKTRLHRARALLRTKLGAQASLNYSDLYAFAGKRCDRVVAAVMQRIKYITQQL